MLFEKWFLKEGIRTNSWQELCIILVCFLLAIVISCIIFSVIYFSYFYIHEGGHIAYGYLDNKLHGRSSDFEISVWKNYALFPLLKIPQQTSMLEGESSLNLAFGGSILVIALSLFICYIIWKITKKKIYFIFAGLFAYHEFFGNFLCGTDNFIGSPYEACVYFKDWWSYPFFLAFIMTVSILLYPLMYRIVLQFTKKTT